MTFNNPSAHRVQQLESLIRKIRNNMMQGDDEYQDRCGELVLNIQRRCRAAWKDRHNKRFESMLNRQGY